MLVVRVGCPPHRQLRARFAWRCLIGRHRWQGRRGVAAIDYPRGMPSKEEVVEALRQVEDPELGMDIVELGLFYDAEIEGENVKVQYTLTSMGCPAGAMIQEDIERVVREIPGVGEVTSDLTFEPPWTPDKMSDDAKFILGFG
jgi:metal-sulfur cluster biosynthetic enzyme